MNYRPVGCGVSGSSRPPERLIENITLGSAAVGYLAESMHGAGSRQAQRIMISRLADLKGRQKKARKLCSIITESIS